MHKIIYSLFLFALLHTSNGGLYNHTDPLTILTNENFQVEVFHKPTAWIIEFYMNWCGHCQKFASVWREFASDIADWDHTIKVGAIDCADMNSSPICTHYKVTSFPHIRLFSSNVKTNTTGETALSSTSEQLIMEVIEFLVGHTKKKTASETWANLLPFEGTLEDLIPTDADNAVVIIANEEMNEGTFTVMDFGNYPQVYVRTMNPSLATYIGLKFDSVPVLITIDRNGNQETLVLDEETRIGFTNAIFEHFSIERNEINFSDYVVDVGMVKHIPTEITNLPNETVVYLVDMENAINYALKHEVRLYESISGESLLALKNFVHALVEYFPGSDNTNNFLAKLYNFIIKHRELLTRIDYNRALEMLETDDAYLSEERPWIGCRGSRLTLRRYPCGLWTLFHTLTVNAVLKDGNSSSYFPQEVLEGIHGYIKHFFSCRHCSEHFQEMFSVDAKREVQIANDEIMWLWQAHNQVNDRLKGDETEDPLYPKRQFPTQLMCPLCFDWKDDYVETEVLTYLKTIYNPQNISTLGLEQVTNNADTTLRNVIFILVLLFSIFLF